MQEQWQRDWKDYYQILNINTSSSEEEIKKAYRTLIKQYHTDINSSLEAKEKAQEINEAYDVLSNKGKKQKYDEYYNLKNNEKIPFDFIENVSKIFILTMELENLKSKLEKHEKRKYMGTVFILGGILGEISSILSYLSTENKDKMLLVFLAAYATLSSSGAYMLYKEKKFDTTEYLNRISYFEEELAKTLKL